MLQTNKKLEFNLIDFPDWKNSQKKAELFPGKKIFHDLSFIILKLNQIK